MTDLSTKPLYEIMSPVWDVWPELQPPGLWLRPNPDEWCVRTDNIPLLLTVWIATDLCIARMVEGLADHKEIIIQIQHNGNYVRCDEYLHVHPTLVKALAAACIAVKAEAQ